MSKAADAFRTISEVADDLDVPKHVLRFWEARFPQIKPMKRGGGRRYYRPADMDLLRGIRHLLHNEGYTIKGVQKILREQGVESVKGCWRPGHQLPSPEIKGAGARVAVAARRVTRRVRGRRAGAPVDSKAVLAAVIAELKSCRALLTGEEVDAPAAAVRARRRR